MVLQFQHKWQIDLRILQSSSVSACQAEGKCILDTCHPLVILFGRLFGPRRRHVGGEGHIVVGAGRRLVREVGWEEGRPVVLYDHSVILRHVDGRRELIVSWRRRDHFLFLFFLSFHLFIDGQQFLQIQSFPFFSTLWAVTYTLTLKAGCKGMYKQSIVQVKFWGEHNGGSGTIQQS